VELVEQAALWQIAPAPVLGDEAYGENTALRERLHDADREYMLAIGAASKVFAPETLFTVPARAGRTGRPRSRPIPDREPEAISDLIARLGPQAAQTLTFRDGPDGKAMTSRFIFVRVRAAHLWGKGLQQVPREEWLIAEWPEGHAQPLDYWISNLPLETPPERMARLARLRWKIELDYRQLKGELGLDHYEGRSYLGWHHHTALVTAAHGFLTLERQHPNRPRPA
jgi:SRSO17 transposase